MNLDTRQFVVWACKVSRLTRMETAAVVLVLGEGYRPSAAAAQLEVDTNKACAYFREGIRKLAVQEWEMHELELFERMTEQHREDESAYAHAVALLNAIRNSQDPTPRTVVYDENSRPVGGRSPLVDVEQAVAIGRNTRTLPSKLIRNRSVTAVAIGLY